MTDGLDLFGGHAIDEIPEDNNLPVGTYPETEISSAKVMKSKSGINAIAVNYKDISEDGFGLTAFHWMQIPAEPSRAQYLLRDLKALGLTTEQIIGIAQNVKGTDPETAEVNVSEIEDILADVVGNTGTTKVTEFTNKRTGAKGTNVSFKLDDPAESPVAQTEQTETNSQDTSNWFG